MPKFSKKNYEFVARVLREERESIEQRFPDPNDYLLKVYALNRVVARFATEFKGDNLKFDIERFYAATERQK